MEYWHSTMDWPLDQNWLCEICGNNPRRSILGILIGEPTLTWGFTHGICRCDVCHTPYDMKPSGKIVTKPVCDLKPELRAAFGQIWRQQRIPADEVTVEEWIAAGVAAEFFAREEG